MSSDTRDRTIFRRFRLNHSERLSRPESIVLCVLIVGGCVLDVVSLVSDPSVNPLRAVLSIGTSLTFLLFIWSPLLATSALALAVVLNFIAASGDTALLAGSIAAALVLRLASSPLIFSYIGGLLVSAALVAYGIGVGGAQANIALYLLTATVAGGIGLALRVAFARGHQLEFELAQRAEQERQAILAERRWLAGELHDSIAHHLTIVAMHVQLLDDERARDASQGAIQTAARKALSDLRFVIGLAEDAPRGTEVSYGDLSEAVEEACQELRDAGHPVVCEGDPDDESIPRGAELILARAIREASTNILKYAGPGEVRLALEPSLDQITLTIRSPQPDTPRRDLPSTGTGLNRMAERVLGVKGEFTAGPEGEHWVVRVRLPLSDQTSPAPTSAEEVEN